MHTRSRPMGAHRRRTARMVRRNRRGMPRVLARIAGLAMAALPIAAAPVPVKRSVRVPMRDGVRLASDVHLPTGAGPWPTVLARTPYNKDGLGGLAKAFTGRGYALVAQDVRGRFASEGKNRVFADDGWGERQDGRDTVEWIARRPWSDGKVGTWGPSALGITQNLAAGAAPPHLVCQFVVVAPSTFYGDAIYQGGVFRKSMLEAWLAGQLALYKLEEYFAHPTRDAYWDALDFAARAPHVRVPVYHVGGWYDIFAAGTARYFQALQTRGGPGARGRQKLLMGPWTHAAGRREAGELTYPADAGMGLEALNGVALRWFDRWLKGVRNGIDEEPPVKVYVMGAAGEAGAPGNRWATFDAWPPPHRIEALYLGAGGMLRRTAPADAEASDRFRYDPLDPFPTVGGGNLFLPAGPRDQRKRGPRKDALSYRTAPLARSLAVVGSIELELWASSSARDVDWAAILVDVYPDGREMLVTDGILRARFRASFREENLLAPGEVALFRVDLGVTALVLAGGHRVGLIVSGGNFPRFERNPQTGAPRPEEGRFARAENRVYRDGGRPSRLLLPVLIEDPGPR